jgi:hypothetical protein
VARNKEISDARNKEIEQIKALKKAQLENVVALENEITKVISDAQDKQSEFLVTKEQAEITAVNDKYFRLIELAKQQGRTQEEIDTLEIAQMNEVNDIKLKGQEQSYADQKAIDDKKAEEKKVADKKEVEDAKTLEQAKQEVRQAGLDNIGNIGKSLQVLAGKNKAIAKAGLIVENAVNIAKIVQNTAVANAKAVAAFPVTGGQPFVAINTISGALSVASSIKATATAMKQLGGGDASGGGATVSGGSGGGGSATPAVGFQTSSENQIATTINSNQQEAPIVKAYVVSSDVSTAQAIDRNKVEANSLGGG